MDVYAELAGVVRGSNVVAWCLLVVTMMMVVVVLLVIVGAVRGLGGI